MKLTNQMKLDAYLAFDSTPVEVSIYERIDAALVAALAQAPDHHDLNNRLQVWMMRAEAAEAALERILAHAAGTLGRSQ